MNTAQQINPKSERLEARISSTQKKLFQHAANLCGRSLTDFTINALQEMATRIIQEHEVIRLSIQDQQLFVKALFAPVTPNQQLLAAAKRHQKAVKA